MSHEAAAPEVPDMPPPTPDVQLPAAVAQPPAPPIEWTERVAMSANGALAIALASGEIGARDEGLQRPGADHRGARARRREGEGVHTLTPCR